MYLPSHIFLRHELGSQSALIDLLTGNFQANVKILFVAETKLVTETIARFHMQENGDPFFRRVGYVTFPLYTSASAWTLCGTI